MRPIAHIGENDHVHLLDQHLRESAKKALEFADAFGFGEWAYLAALWHDLGKYSQAFQTKLLRDPEKRVDHSTAGAQYAARTLPEFEGRVLAYLIAGHHAGLADWSSADGGKAALKERLKKTVEAWKDNVDSPLLASRSPLPPAASITDASLWVRMIFSALVDADFLDTEAFFDSDRSMARGNYPSIPDLLDHFDRYMQKLQHQASDTSINRLRQEILSRCIETAKDPGGIYTLTVPTGGGKTLSSMAYALYHAMQHHKRRIIYVIPYTSIIEQNAGVYRQIFNDAVIEHHSQFTMDDEERPELTRAKLAAENWDAPIIVTTTVQFFESLFAAKPSRCRKLHNIAKSVVIIDEVQTLPIPYLQAIVDKINALQKDYDTTFLLCSATQPAFESFRLFEGTSFYGIESAKEIVPEPEKLAQKLRRTRIVWEHEEPKSYETLAQEVIQTDRSALIVVNTRHRAQKLYEILQEIEVDALHLSANMCGQHRSRVIGRIRERLQSGKPFIVVSTNLIEAGVDLDFPLAWRELAGLDSIAQTAGRCNREGKLPEPGIVTVFSLSEESKPLYLRPAIDTLIEIFPDIQADPLSPSAFHRYFDALFKRAGECLDQKEVAVWEKRYIGEWRFATVAERFSMIEDGYTQSVIVPYDEKAKDYIAKLKIESINRGVLRKLQRYSINLSKMIVDKLLDSREIEERFPGALVLSNENLYTETIGFDESKIGIYDVENLVT